MPLTEEQIARLEAKGDISPQTADLLRAESQSPGSITAAPKTLQLPTPSIPPSSGPGEIDQEFLSNATVTGPSSVSPEALAASTPAPFPSAQPQGAPPPAQPQGASTAAAPPPAQPLSDSGSLIQRGIDTQRAAITEAMLAQTKAEGEIVGEQIRQAQRIEDARLDEERFQKEKSQRLDEAKNLYTQALDALNTETIDPDRFYAKLSTPDKILAAIGIALGGIASGMTGGPNQALKVIQDAVAQDVDAQRINMEKNTRIAGARGNVYSELVSRLQNEEASRHYLTSLMLERSKATLAQYEAQIQSANQKAQLGRLYGELDIAAAEAQAKAQEALEKDPRFGAAIRAGVNEGKIDPATLPKEDRERYIQGIGFAKDKQAADEIIKGQERYRNIVQLLDKIMADRKEFGAELMGDVVGRQKTRAGALRVMLKDLFSLGQLSAGDYTLIDSQVPENPMGARLKTPFGRDPVLVQLEEAKKTFTDGYLNKLKTLVEPAPNVQNATTELPINPR